MASSAPCLPTSTAVQLVSSRPHSSSLCPRFLFLYYPSTLGDHFPLFELFGQSTSRLVDFCSLSPVIQFLRAEDIIPLLSGYNVLYVKSAVLSVVRTHILPDTSRFVSSSIVDCFLLFTLVFSLPPGTRADDCSDHK